MHQPEPQSRSFKELLHTIENGTLKIPQFQRDFVWTREKSAKLIDSILKGYPIGTFILWKTREQLRAVKNIGGVDLPPTPEGDYAEQVLDGQQRLTSLYAAVNGLTITRTSGSTEDFSQICVDLDEDPTTETTIAFSSSPENAEAGRFVRLREVIAKDFNFLSGLSEARRVRLQSYSERINEYRFSAILIKDAPLDVATEIFTRINVGGKPLSVFEVMVAKTYDQESDFDLQHKYTGLMEELAKVEYETLPQSSVLQFASILLTGEAKKRDILGLRTADFRATWPRVEEGFKRAVDYFRGTFRVRASRMLPYGSLIIPFAAFFDEHPDRPTAEQTQRLREFFWRVALTGRYTSAVEGKLGQDVHHAKKIANGEEPEFDASFSVSLSPHVIDQKGFFRTSRSFAKAMLCLLSYQQPRSFDDGSTVNIDNDWLKQSNSKNYHHFFPKSALRKRGVDARRANHIGNITIVDDFLNKKKIGTRMPSDYMAEYREENADIEATMATHLITLDDAIWNDDYEAFLQARCATFSKHIREWVPERSIDDSASVLEIEDDDPDAESDDSNE